MDFLIAYLIVGVYVSVLGYAYDPPPAETAHFTPLEMAFINIFGFLFGFLVLTVIWPLVMWTLAKEYPRSEV